MDKKITLTEEQLRNLIQQTIQESLDEVGLGQRMGAWFNRKANDIKTGIGAAAAGAKSMAQMGGTTAAQIGANNYRAQKNSEYSAKMKEKAKVAIRKVNAQFDEKFKQLRDWRKAEKEQINKMYGADVYAAAAKEAETAANDALQKRTDFNQYNRMVAESIEKIVKNVLKEYLA